MLTFPFFLLCSATLKTQKQTAGAQKGREIVRISINNASIDSQNTAIYRIIAFLCEYTSNFNAEATLPR